MRLCVALLLLPINRSAFLKNQHQIHLSSSTMERVHFQQEQMLEELKDLVEKNLFTEVCFFG
jgi:hypothetical protein